MIFYFYLQVYTLGTKLLSAQAHQQIYQIIFIKRKFLSVGNVRKFLSEF